MLSGIATATRFAAHDIPVVVDFPGVGQDLQDHLCSGAVRAVLKQPMDLGGRATDYDAALAEFDGSGDGQLAMHHFDAGAFLKFDASDPVREFDVVITVTLAEHYRTDGQLDCTCIDIGGWISRPQSRGSVTLASADRLDRSSIDPNKFGGPHDLGLTMKGDRRRVDTLNAGPFDEVNLGRADPGDIDEAALDLRVRRGASTIWHPTSSRAGTDERDSVGPDLPVQRIEGLRVRDASVMPLIVGMNTMATTIMIGEKTSDLGRQ